MENQTQNPNQGSDSNTTKKEPKSEGKTVASKIKIILFIFIILNVILMALFYFALKSKLQDNKILGDSKIWNIVNRCSSEHPEFCDKNCNTDNDCYPTCTHDCGCIKSGEVCDDEILCEFPPFSCECENNKCEIIEYEDMEVNSKVNIIGNYTNEITSMCSQNCDRYYVGSYELENELQDIDGINKREIVFAGGEMTTIKEPPTIAGPDYQPSVFSSAGVETVKLKVNNYQKINFPKISISESERSKYLDNEDSKFIFEFENPLSEELKFKVRMNDEYDFQHFILQSKEVKKFEYVYAKDSEEERHEDDSFGLVIINDFVDSDSFKKYYWDSAENINSGGTMIYVDKYVHLDDFEIDTSDWKTYKNEKYGFEISYPKYFIISKGETIRINIPFVPGTNLSVKYLEIKIRDNNTKCSNPAQTIIEKTEEVDINGIKFKKEIGADHGAGHTFDSTSYSTVKKDKCFGLSFILNRTSDGVNESPFPISDKEQEEIKVFDQIISTFKFTDKK